MKYWLFKSEPTTFSIDHLKQSEHQTTHWEGVRNYQVRNMLRDEVKVGDQVFFYHSNTNPPGVAGIMEVVRSGYPDDSAWDLASQYYDSKSSLTKPIWYMVNVQFIKKFKHLISLAALKSCPELKSMPLLRPGNRLSITPVSKEEWETIIELQNPM